MRKYQPVWEAIKKDKVASLAAPVSSHRRIIQAVRKEKSKDFGYKLLTAEDGHRCKLYETVEGKLITFTLTTLPLPLHISIHKL